MIRVYFQPCPHEERTRVLLILFAEMSMRNAVAQSLLCIQHIGLPDIVPGKSSGALFWFVEEGKELYSRCIAASWQVVNTKKQHSCKA